MILNYLKTALRNMRRNRLATGLNWMGLGVAFAAIILIFLWVEDELGYDKFTPGAERIFRLVGKVGPGAGSGLQEAVGTAMVPTAFAAAIGRAVPEVRRVTHLYDAQKLMTVGTRKFEEKRIFCVDTNFLEIFNYPLLRGNKTMVLREPNSVLLTETTAKKYFGNVDAAMGQRIFDENDSLTLEVAGVLWDVPAQSHLQFDLLLPERMGNSGIDPTQTWRYFDCRTYLQLGDEVEPDVATLRKIEQRLKDIRDKNIVNTPAVPASWTLQALPDIHLRSNLKNDLDGQGNIQSVRLFSLIALFILAIACINFMNLSTAMASKRAKEVGLRKTIGALRRQLIAQFLGESILLALLSQVLALTLVALALPFFNELSGKSISLPLLNGWFLLKVIGIALAAGLLAGCYPAFYLSASNAVQVLKGARVVKGSLLRNGLVVLQFALSVILIICTIIIYDQLQFLHNRDIGFDKNNLLYFRIAELAQPGDGGAALKLELRQNPAIADVSCSWQLPDNMGASTPLRWRGMDNKTLVLAVRTGGDDRYASTLGLKMVAGRYYSPTDGRDRYVINEKAARAMGVDASAAIGKLITLNDLEGPVIGVVKDFNFRPANQPIGPLVIKHDSNDDIILVRTKPGTTRQTLAAIQSGFARYYGNAPFSYGFVDQDLDRLYRAEARMGFLFTIFSALSILICCLGLFGLATFATQRRAKEIGVRKVLGAGEAGIVALLAREFLVLVGLSLLIAFPVAGWAMDRWLEGFAYKVTISGWVFAAAGAMALSIAFVTVSYQTIKTAMVNPVQSLRSE
ncbi:MAG TPA: ABC transporter permease [Puia sp.]|uniref:ABC transporter permease n=1 Tax=Puia sp. TaxID=2045100 RepID=UPI002BD9E22D|nr:ABC transporter permease [Puia sp.]HVU99450.1 ABC transporter permease [Puia sp.]